MPGCAAVSLVFFLGGVPETVDLTVGSWKNDVDARVQLFNEMREALENKSLMAAAISVRESPSRSPSFTALQHICV